MSKGYALVLCTEEAPTKITYWVFKNYTVRGYERKIRLKEQPNELMFFVKGTLLHTNGWAEPYNGSWSFSASHLIRCRNKDILDQQLLKYLL